MIHSLVSLIMFLMMRFPIPLTVSYVRTKLQQGLSADLPAIHTVLVHNVGHLQTLLPDYVIKRRRKQRCVLNFVDFTSLHHTVGSSVLSLLISWQIADRNKEAVRRKPTKYSISGLQLIRARNVAHVDVAT